MKLWAKGGSLETGEMKEAPPVHWGAPNKRPGGREGASAVSGEDAPSRPGLPLLACLLLPAASVAPAGSSAGDPILISSGHETDQGQATILRMELLHVR